MTIRKIFLLIYFLCIILAFLLALLLFQHYGQLTISQLSQSVLLFIIASILIGILVLVLLLHGRVIRPILLGTQILEQIIAGNNKSRWDVPYQNELQSMAQAFNQVLDHDQQQRQFLEKKMEETQELLKVTQNMQQEIEESNKRQQQLAQASNQLKTKVCSATQRLQLVHNTLRQKTQEQADTEYELQRMKREAERANQGKNALITTVSHELRTPLTAIITLTEMLLKGNIADEQQHHLLIIQDNTRHLLRVIEDILDLAQMESGRLRIEQSDFDLLYTIKHTLRPLVIQAKNKSLYLQCHIDETIPQYLKGDALRLRQIFTNLINNAIKFTDRGGIKITVNAIDLEHFQLPPGRILRKKEGQAILFTVQDSGIGIPLEQQPLIFDAFYIQPIIHRNKYGGSGLGLSICRQLLESMGGVLWVESEVGAGSKFSFVICFHLGDRDRVTTEKTKQLDMIKKSTTSLKILLAEDNPTNAQITIRLLTKLGHVTTIATNGREAVECLAQDQFDLVLMDIEMPEMDGLEATQLIRKGEAGEMNQKIPILGITAHTFAEIYEKCFMAGMNDFILRPINLDNLHNMIQQYTHTATTSSTPKLDEQSNNDTTTLMTNAFGEILDIQGALKRLCGDQLLLQDVFQNFLQHFPERLNKLKTAIQKCNAEEIAFQAHAVKGTTSQIGAKTCTALAISLEEMAKERNMQNTPKLMEQLEQESQKVVQILQNLQTK